MSQIALPLARGEKGPRRIVVGAANAAAIEALAHPETWPFRTAVLLGPPRAGKSLLARWFAEQRLGEAVDDADRLDETGLFHRWNRAQEAGTALLLVAGEGWRVALPDLASRLKVALHLAILAPDDAMLAELIAAHAEARGLAVSPEGIAYLAARSGRSHIAVERLVSAIDRISLERKAPPGMAVLREALEQEFGPEEPRLL